MIKVASEAAQVLVAKACEAGQEHLFAWWSELDPSEQRALLDQIREIDFQLLAHLVKSHVKGAGQEKVEIGPPEPVQPVLLGGTEGDIPRWRKVGEELLAAGKVAVFMAAGGTSPAGAAEGAPGLAPVGPVSQKTLLQLHAEKVLALNRRYHVQVPFVIMTSPETRRELEAFLKEHRFFTLPQGSVLLVDQPRLPVVDRRGKILMADKGKIAMAPNGHGGAVELLKRPELRSFLENRSVECVFYFHIDNPLVQVADPVFLGLHKERNAEVSAKAVRRESPDERVGIFAQRGRALVVVEYSEVSPELRAKKDPETGELLFAWGNTGTHIFSMSFISKWEREDKRLPYHCVEQRVRCIDRKGRRIQPTKCNAFRFECYVFDSFRWASSWVLFEAERAEEFFPLSGRVGARFLEAGRRALSLKYARWLEAAGGRIPRSPDGAVRGTYEISPLYALDKEELKEKWNGAEAEVPDVLYLE